MQRSDVKSSEHAGATWPRAEGCGRPPEREAAKNGFPLEPPDGGV